MFFDAWYQVWRVVAVGSLAYVSLVLVLRLFGKRTLAKLNAFDLVVTVALGSTLASILLSSDVALLEGVVAFALLAGAQAVLTWSSVRSRRLRRAVRAEPALLVADGRLCEDALADQRVTLSELRQAVRSSGSGGLDSIAAVVLETDGTLSVIPKDKAGDGWALEHIHDRA